MLLNAKWRKVVYIATLAITALSAVMTGLAAAFGIVTVEAVEKGTAVAGMILGIVTPLLAMANLTPDSTDE